MAAAAPYSAVKPRTPSRLGAFALRMRNEFALRPHRVRSALRSATIGAIGAGIMTAAHIASPLGPYVVWMLAGTPTSMMSWRIAVVFTVAEAALIGASVIVARTLSQSPPLMLLFLGAFGFAATYLINRYKLGSFGIIGEVLMLDNLYGVMFAPEQLGWRAGSGFAAVAVAIGLLALFDNLLWPDPADAILLESLAANLGHIRLRILESTRYYLDEHRGPIPPKIANWRELSGRLTLLARAQAEGISEHRRGVLLAIITRVARIESESDVIALLAAENPIPPAARALQSAIAAVVDAIGEALEEVATDPATMLRTGPDDAPAPAAALVITAIQMLDSRIEEQRPNYIKRLDAAELTNLSAFLSSLRAISRLLERPLDEPAATPEGGRAIASTDDTGSGLERYSLKVAISVVLAFVVGLASQRADLSTIMTTVIIAGLPTYGGSRRKMNLRIIGSVLGGAITVAAIIITAPNFETLPSYMMVFFVVLLISAYAGQGSERIAYAGKQIGTTMALVFVGLSPSTAIDAPLWRIWGILLGTSVVALVFLFLWPEYSGKSLLPRLRKALGLAIVLDPRGGLSEVTIRQHDAELAGLLEQLLAIAEDARMEGRARGGLNPDAVINAAGNLRRVAHRFERIALMRMRQPRPQLDRETKALEEAAVGGIVKQLEAWHAYFAHPDCLKEGGLSILNSTESITAVLENFAARIEADSFARLTNWEAGARRTLLAELQSLRRLDFLVTELNKELSRIVQQQNDVNRYF